ncbi:MAG: hypothetical protein KAR13_16190 [Desulfobulbaceae bacterium]|nr:hypothetical protein [Desulfobulbaceae bacterium]
MQIDTLPGCGLRNKKRMSNVEQGIMNVEVWMLLLDYCWLVVGEKGHLWTKIARLENLNFLRVHQI